MLLACTTPTLSQVFFGAGGTPCNRFLTGATNRSLAYYEASEWLLGYASGKNSARTATNVIDPLLSTNSANLVTFVEGYCASNPEHPIVKAADDWFKALAKP